MTIEADFSGAKFKIKRLGNILNEPEFVREFNYLLEQEPRRIKNRTLKGLDANESQFKAYDPAYREWKNSTGKKKKAHLQARGATVNLTLSGAMLQSMKTRISSTAKDLTGHLFIASDQAIKARRHNEGLAGMPQREFLGFSKTFRKMVSNLIRKFIHGR